MNSNSYLPRVASLFLVVTVGCADAQRADAGEDTEADPEYMLVELDADHVTDAGRVQCCLDCHAAAYNSELVVGFEKSR